MTTYAQVHNNVVVNCIVADATFIASLPNAADFHLYDESQPAGIGWSWDDKNKRAIPPQPFPSWVLNEDTCRWDSPTPYPTDGKQYVWNENKREWEEVVVHGE